MPFVFPIDLLNPGVIKLSKGRRVLSGGVSISGIEDVVETDAGGYWMCTLSNTNLYTPRLLKLWDAWDSHLGAGGVECFLPILSVATSPRPFAGSGFMSPSNLTYTGTEFFPTDVYRSSPYIISEITADALMGVTQISLDIIQGARLTGGEKFSIYHINGPGLYSVERIISAIGQSAVIKIWPPLRDDVDDGTSINFDWPMMRARLSPGYDMSSEVEYNISNVSASFVEATGDA